MAWRGSQHPLGLTVTKKDDSSYNSALKFNPLKADKGIMKTWEQTAFEWCFSHRTAVAAAVAAAVARAVATAVVAAVAAAVVAAVASAVASAVAAVVEGAGPGRPTQMPVGC